MKGAFLCFAAASIWLVGVAGNVRGDLFGSGANSFEIVFVTIGQPGNPADTTGDRIPPARCPTSNASARMKSPSR